MRGERRDLIEGFPRLKVLFVSAQSVHNLLMADWPEELSSLSTLPTPPTTMFCNPKICTQITQITKKCKHCTTHYENPWITKVLVRVHKGKLGLQHSTARVESLSIWERRAACTCRALRLWALVNFGNFGLVARLDAEHTSYMTLCGYVGLEPGCALPHWLNLSLSFSVASSYSLQCCSICLVFFLGVQLALGPLLHGAMVGGPQHELKHKMNITGWDESSASVRG